MPFDDDFCEVFRTFQTTARRIVAAAPPLRAALPPPPALVRAAKLSLDVDPGDAASARRFFARHFEPRRLDTPGFLTGYYEPSVAGSLTPTAQFCEPILARPADLVSFAPGEDPALTAARKGADGALYPYPDRAEIEETHKNPVVWLADAVEVFFIQVQGSARVNLPDGRQVRLVYDGRNGKPYSSIGRHLIETGAIRPEDMSLARLKSWLRENGLEPGERGRETMRLNRSYIFFRLEDALDPADGPIGGAGAPLTTLRSLAVDRTLWPYGLPYTIEAELPWRGAQIASFRRLMIGQDTGSAIVGPARFDIFFGTGDAAGERAGSIRHPAAITAFWPRETTR